MTSPPSKFGGAIPKKMPSPAAQVGFLLSLYYVTQCVCRPVGKILKLVGHENDRDACFKECVEVHLYILINFSQKLALTTGLECSYMCLLQLCYITMGCALHFSYTF